MENLSNQVANFFHTQGYSRGDTVALLLESRPEYVCIWLGLSKIGVVTALINNNLVADPLIHSVKVSNAKAVIYGSDFRQGNFKYLCRNRKIQSTQFENLFAAIETVEQKLPQLALFELDESPANGNFTALLEAQSCESPKDLIKAGQPKDKLLFIYTSGTTGLPKAAVITHMRYTFMALGLNYMSGLTDSDIVYDPLPLYHSAGGIVGVGQALVNGLTVVIRRKFSATNYWTDCIKYNCTVTEIIYYNRKSKNLFRPPSISERSAAIS